VILPFFEDKFERMIHQSIQTENVTANLKKIRDNNTRVRQLSYVHGDIFFFLGIEIIIL